MWTVTVGYDYGINNEQTVIKTASEFGMTLSMRRLQLSVSLAVLAYCCSYVGTVQAIPIVLYLACS